VECLRRLGGAGIPWLITWMAGGHSAWARWLTAAGLALLLVLLIAAVLRLWPASRRWARLNRLHTLAERNQADLRAAARQQLDDAL
jgi:hypothetical protein